MIFSVGLLRSSSQKGLLPMGVCPQPTPPRSRSPSPNPDDLCVDCRTRLPWFECQFYDLTRKGADLYYRCPACTYAACKRAPHKGPAAARLVTKAVNLFIRDPQERQTLGLRALSAHALSSPPPPSPCHRRLRPPSQRRPTFPLAAGPYSP